MLMRCDSRRLAMHDKNRMLQHSKHTTPAAYVLSASLLRPGCCLAVKEAGVAQSGMFRSTELRLSAQHVTYSAGSNQVISHKGTARVSH